MLSALAPSSKADFPLKTIKRPTPEDFLLQVKYDKAVSNVCPNCDRPKLSSLSPQDHEELVIHYGLIVFANYVGENSRRRD
jgi:hypothetical protein